MKNLFKKVSSLFLVALLFTTMLGSQKASARTINNPNWRFEITQVGNTKDYGDDLYAIADMQNASSGNTYNVNTNYVAIQCKFTNANGSNCVWVDDKFTGKDRLLDYKEGRNTIYRTLLVENLTPGTHKIEIKAALFTGVNVKSDYIYVTIPAK